MNFGVTFFSNQVQIKPHLLSSLFSPCLKHPKAINRKQPLRHQLDAYDQSQRISAQHLNFDECAIKVLYILINPILSHQTLGELLIIQMGWIICS